MYQPINQTIQVGVKFSLGKVHPVWFEWQGRKYRIDQVNLYHRSFKGEAPIHHFSVTAGGDCYRLSFDGKRCKWTIQEVWVE